MIIRCPYCEFSRTVSESKIPATAETATCPKCKQRFRFRTVEAATAPIPSDVYSQPRKERLREKNQGGKVDIWEAVDSLNQRWQRQMEENVTDVTPPKSRIQRDDFADQSTSDSSNDLYATDRFSSQSKNTTSSEENVRGSKNRAGVKPSRKKKTDKSSGLFSTLPFLRAIFSKKEEEGTTASSLHTSEPLVSSKIGRDASFNEKQYPSTFAEDTFPFGEVSKHANESGVREQVDLSEESLTVVEETLTVVVEEYQTEEVNSSAAINDTISSMREAVAESVEKISTATQQQLNLMDASALPAQPSVVTVDSSNLILQEVETPQGEDVPVQATEEPKQRFLFGEGSELAPEERVERDIQFLKSKEERPIVNLGKLNEFEEESPEQVAYDIPWENPAKHGWFAAFFQTVKEVMFNTPVFFAGISKDGSLVFPFLFFLIQGYLAIICTLLWRHVTSIVLDQPELSADTLGLPVLLLLSPIALGMLLLMASSGMRLTLEIFSDSKSTFSYSCKVVCYAVAPLMLSVIPFIGPIAGTLWFLFALAIGCRSANGLTWPQAILAALPASAMLIFGILLFFI